MKQIKTVQFKTDSYEEFDEAVNSLLADGWILVDRFRTEFVEGNIHTSFPMYVAFLEREVPHE